MPPKKPQENSKQKILIVEDNELNLKLFRDLLEAHGFQTIETQDGSKAIGLITQHQPDLVLMDIQLPEISGLDIIADIKRNPSIKHIPVIAVTAFAMKDDESRILKSGCEGYISKPIAIAQFMATIHRYLGKGTA